MTSQAATTITMIAKIWPSPLPCMRAERDQREVAGVEHQLQAEQDHQRVAPRQHAGGADAEDQRRDDEIPADVHSVTSRPRSRGGPRPLGRGRSARSADGLGHRAAALARAHVQHASGARRGVVVPAAAPAREHDRADGGDQQQERGDLERRGGIRSAAARRSAPACRSRAVVLRRPRRRAPAGREPSTAIDSSTNSAPANSERRCARSAGPSGVERLDRAADVGDDEHVEHHHRAGVDDDLRGGDELRAQQQEQRRQREQVADQREHRVERVAQRDDADRARRSAPIAAMKKTTSAKPGAYSSSLRSGVRSSGSASSISLVKMRSTRL